MENQTSKINATRIVLVLIISLIVCICFSCGYFAYISWKSLQPIEGAQVTVDLPPAVEVGDDIDLNIEIFNESDEALTLNSINIGAEFIDGIQIGDSNPIFEYRDHIELFGNQLDMFIFNELILAGESLTVSFDAEAISVGDFTGQMMVCLNKTTECEIFFIRTVVEEIDLN